MYGIILGSSANPKMFRTYPRLQEPVIACLRKQTPRRKLLRPYFHDFPYTSGHVNSSRKVRFCSSKFVILALQVHIAGLHPPEFEVRRPVSTNTVSASTWSSFPHCRKRTKKAFSSSLESQRKRLLVSREAQSWACVSNDLVRCSTEESFPSHHLPIQGGICILTNVPTVILITVDQALCESID